MNTKVKEEIKSLIETLELNCTIKEFKDKVSWINISIFHKLSEEFIKEFQDKVSWNSISYHQKLSEGFIREFKNEVNWNRISISQKLSEGFIKEFKDKVNWINISYNHKLSEAFIKEFQDKVNWIYISSSQNLSEGFIKEFQDKVNWDNISISQKLSEEFIKEFQDKVNWYNISYSQNLSEEFIKEFQDKVNVEGQEQNHKEKSNEQKLKEVTEYAEIHNLEIDDNYLYAFRNHDVYGRGMYNKTISYEKGKYYSDWHCDMNETNQNSFGLGIFPKGNTKVKVKIEDWGCSVSREDGKARVWGFEIV